MNQHEVEKLEARERMIAAWEKKYGEPVPRVIANFLLVAPPDQVVRRFGGSNPGPHVSEEGAGEGVDTAALGIDEGWAPIIGHDAEAPCFSGDPKSLTERMVPIYRKAFEEVRKRPPTAAELEAVMAVGRSESIFGTAKFPGGLGPGMHNHGAVQCHKDCTEDNSFQSWDTKPLDAGGSERYDQRFRRYASDEEGAADLIRKIGNDPLRMLKASGGLLPAFSLGMYGNHYYEMRNAPPTSVVANRSTYDWIRANAKKYPTRTKGSTDAKWKWFTESGMGRATDPIHAGRVLMHSIGLSGSADAIAKALGVKRATRMVPSLVGDREAVGAATGAILGLAAGGPLGGGIGALVGYFAGRATR